MFPHQMCEHYNEATRALTRFKSPATRLSAQQLFRPPPLTTTKLNVHTRLIKGQHSGNNLHDITKRIQVNLLRTRDAYMDGAKP